MSIRQTLSLGAALMLAASVATAQAAQGGKAPTKDSGKMAAKGGKMDAKMDAKGGKMDAKMDAKGGKMDAKMDAKGGKMGKGGKADAKADSGKKAPPKKAP